VPSVAPSCLSQKLPIAARSLRLLYLPMQTPGPPITSCQPIHGAIQQAPEKMALRPASPSMQLDNIAHRRLPGIDTKATPGSTIPDLIKYLSAVEMDSLPPEEMEDLRARFRKQFWLEMEGTGPPTRYTRLYASFFSRVADTELKPKRAIPKDWAISLVKDRIFDRSKWPYLSKAKDACWNLISLGRSTLRGLFNEDREFHEGLARLSTLFGLPNSETLYPRTKQVTKQVSDIRKDNRIKKRISRARRKQNAERTDGPPASITTPGECCSESGPENTSPLSIMERPVEGPQHISNVGHSPLQAPSSNPEDIRNGMWSSGNFAMRDARWHPGAAAIDDGAWPLTLEPLGSLGPAIDDGAWPLTLEPLGSLGPAIDDGAWPLTLEPLGSLGPAIDDGAWPLTLEPLGSLGPAIDEGAWPIGIVTSMQQ
jgi:hypothetical protein